MKCPYCGNIETKVTDSRVVENGNSIRRRRSCEECNERFTTYERIETTVLTVVKRNKTREPFNKDKLFNGILKSCNKRQISRKQMEDIVLEIENIIKNSPNKEIESTNIGEITLRRLKEIDQVAYVRFASVYRQFEDIDSFMNELHLLMKENKFN